MTIELLNITEHAELQNLSNEEIQKLIASDVCPDCKGQLAHESGCLVCHLCGWSVC